MLDEVIEKLRENAPYVAIGVAAGFFLRNMLEEMMVGDELVNYKNTKDCGSY